MNQSNSKNPSASSILLTVLLVFFIVVFIISASILISYIVKSNAEENRYNKNEELDNLSSILAPSTSSPDFTVFSYTTTTPIGPTDTPNVTTDQTEPDDGTDSDTATGYDTDVPTDSETTPTTEITTTEPPVTTPPPPQYGERLTAIRNSIFELQKINPDIVGYISIPMLEINYPLLSRSDDYGNSYYLNRAYDLSYADSGSIFYDFRCDPDPMNNRNTVIYGHNMRNGSMFGNLKGCINKEKLFREAEITIATLEGIYTFKFFSVYTTDAASDYCRTSFSDDESFNEFYTEIKSNSVYQASFAPEATPLMLTLSTCTNLDHDGRYAFHAILTGIER